MPIQLNSSTSTGAGASTSTSTSTSSTSQQQQTQSPPPPPPPQQAQPGATLMAAPSSHTTRQSGDGQLSKEEAERLFEERMEEDLNLEHVM
ncbi:hypothetical protein EMCG_08832 [[Emmonsia] crescens]|uniref:Uncharacterized protein n=1 Tax=[Emmonsia] crescens TaxID=73230 RepID=A0A0G2JA90_9EURO|nr:hypothetical protein EMCG_08832 [Emmonsia crescens UAMH 3008]